MKEKKKEQINPVFLSPDFLDLWEGHCCTAPQFALVALSGCYS